MRIELRLRVRARVAVRLRVRVGASVRLRVRVNGSSPLTPVAGLPELFEEHLSGVAAESLATDLNGCVCVCVRRKETDT